MFSNTYILIMFPTLFNLFLTVFNIQLFSFIQKNVDNDFLGRIFGIIFTVAIMFMPLGTVFFTVLLDPQNLFNFSIIGLFIFILSLLFFKFLNKKH